METEEVWNMTNEMLPVCPRCGKTAQAAEAAFCAFCGAPMKSVSATPVPAEAQKLLDKAQKTNDPKKKFKLLTQAMEQHPDCLPVAEALLMLGRLPQRDPRTLDFSVIKCHLWHVFLTPQDFSAEKQQQMRTEFFDCPDLDRCLRIAPDRDVFLRRYLQTLARDFVQLFLRGSNHYMHSFFGFKLDSRAARTLADPAAVILGRIHADDAFTAEQRALLYDAFYRGFSQDMGGDTQWLDQKLRAAELPLPVQM